ncbi:MAG: insulinase family protein [Clostridia bacterium]|nr:insulinase family protein [Clostridia bacterium]
MTNIPKTSGISYSFIPTNRFKTTLISVGFYLPLSKNNASNALTLSLMKSGTEALSDTYLLNRKLASLYGAGITSWVAKQGDCQELRIGITVNDNKYSLNGENVVDEAGALLCDMIFGRFISGSNFPKDAIAREKRLLCEAIEGKLNDKRTYARNRCEEIMCEGEPYGLAQEGTVDEVNAVTDNDIRLSLEKMLKTAFISVLVIGAKEPTLFAERFFECVNSVRREFKSLPSDTVSAAGELREVTETMPVKQGKVVLGLRSPNGGNDRDTVANWVMGDIFGGGPYSKLFCNVREKMSLCYYCSARPVRRKGIILVDSGVEDANIESAKAAILDQLNDMVNGNFSDKDITSSKLSMCDSIRSAESEQESLARWYAARALEESPASPSEICELITSVTKEDIMNAAKTFTLDTVYILRPDGSLKEEEE